MPKRQDIKSILIIGAGPIIIGQACEFDYSGAQACKALNISPITATATRITAILPAIGQTRAPQCFARRRGFFFFALFMSFPPV